MQASDIKLGLPLLARELMEQAVRRRTYIIRVVYAVLLFVVAYFMFYDLLRGTSAGMFAALGHGRQMFDMLLVLQFAGVYIFMPAIGASAIAVEKERSTFALRLLTKLDPWTIIFEKLLSRMVPMLTFLLLGLPLLGFAYTLGGFQTDEFIYGGLALGLALLQTSALALFCSAFCRTTTGALIAAYALQVMLMFGPPMIVETNVLGLQALFRSAPNRYGDWIFFAPYLTSLWEQNTISSSMIVNIIYRLIQFVPLTMVTAMLLVATRVVILRRAFALPQHRLQKVFRRLDGVFSRWNENPYTRGITLVAEAARLPETRPIAWIETTRTALGSLRYLVRLLLVVETLVVCLVLLVANTSENAGEYVSMLVFLAWIGATALVAVKGSSLIAGERSRQTLDVLLTLPIPTRELLAQKLTGVRRLMLVLSVPMLTLFLFQAWWRAGPMTGQPWMDQSRVVPALYLTSAISCMVLFFHGAAWLSILIGLRSKSQTRAVLISLGAIVAACMGPLLLMFLIEVIFEPPEKHPVNLFFLTSPMASVAFNEFNVYTHMFRSPWLAVALNTVYYGCWWVGLRTVCLRRAPRWLGRTCELITETEVVPAGESAVPSDPRRLADAAVSD